MNLTDKINVKMLTDKTACEEGVKWFVEKFKWETTFDKLLKEIEKDRLYESNWDG
jgi:pyruvate dehydrogenase complex dehydrogenase (E1) component